ncbi:MAG: RNA polymerase sigma factor [Bacteroidota bacterium]
MTVNEYNQCVEEFSDSVYRFILKNIKNEEKAKDTVQDSFEKMWVKAKEISFEKAKSYLFTTAYRTMIDSIRKDSRQSLMEPAHENILTCNNDYSDLKEVIDEAVDKLPEIQRSALLLRDYEGYSYEEIGQITSLSESQVKVYIFRARAFLKNYIGSLETVI